MSGGQRLRGKWRRVRSTSISASVTLPGAEESSRNAGEARPGHAGGGTAGTRGWAAGARGVEARQGRAGGGTAGASGVETRQGHAGGDTAGAREWATGDGRGTLLAQGDDGVGVRQGLGRASLQLHFRECRERLPVLAGLARRRNHLRPSHAPD